ncbi:hypothetical protein PRIPAC_88722, partial [Pristionchus pacificus]
LAVPLHIIFSPMESAGECTTPLHILSFFSIFIFFLVLFCCCAAFGVGYCMLQNKATNKNQPNQKPTKAKVQNKSTNYDRVSKA